MSFDESESGLLNYFTQYFFGIKKAVIKKIFIPLHRQNKNRQYNITKGRMPEWSIGAVSKTVVPLREPRVR
ncbi:MAG: hypothetical protein K2G72_01505, partial [Duncaniella sp.]|nr:hypothetical protein [Duncaniella sp.]